MVKSNKATIAIKGDLKPVMPKKESNTTPRKAKINPTITTPIL